MDVSKHTRTLVTLGVLVALFLGGITWAWSQVTEPFPEPLEVSKCTAHPVQVGERIRPEQVLVTVLNASERNGLAGDTMDGLVDRGFGEGDRGNAPSSTTKRTGAVVWATPGDPVAKLVASYLGKDVRIVDQPSEYPGIVVVVGDSFTGVIDGRKAVTADAEGTVCTPAQEISDEPSADAA
jgi:hypothetical protein